MTYTYNEEQIRARHEARVAQLVEAFGSMLQVPHALVMRLHELNKLDWTVFVAERDSKKVTETIVPARIEIPAATPPADTVNQKVITPHSGATPPVGGAETPLGNAYWALVGTPPGLDGQIMARRALVGMPLL